MADLVANPGERAVDRATDELLSPRHALVGFAVAAEVAGIEVEGDIVRLVGLRYELDDAAQSAVDVTDDGSQDGGAGLDGVGDLIDSANGGPQLRDVADGEATGPEARPWG